MKKFSKYKISVTWIWRPKTGIIPIIIGIVRVVRKMHEDKYISKNQDLTKHRQAIEIVTTRHCTH